MNFDRQVFSPLAISTFSTHLKRFFIIVLNSLFLFSVAQSFKIYASAQSDKAVFVRLKILQPVGNKFRVTVGGFRHAGEPWYFEPMFADVSGNVWSEWIDLSKWQWHERVDRAGGIAEWCSMKLSVANADGAKIENSVFEVQLADAPDEKSIVHNFTEKSASDTIAFLVPFPLRKNAGEFETGSQMTARHAKWAKEATGEKPITVKKFDIVTTFWGFYDPALALTEARSLQIWDLMFWVMFPGNLERNKFANLRLYGFVSSRSRNRRRTMASD